MSSATLKDSPPYPLNDQSFYRFPALADTGTEDAWTGDYLVLTHQTTFNSVQRSLEKFGFAVVMMHPKEFTSIKNGKLTDEKAKSLHPHETSELENIVEMMLEKDTS